MSSFIKAHKKHFQFKKFIALAIVEDAGDGDHTSLSTISKNQIGKMQLLVKEDGIIAGVEAARHIFKQIDAKLKLKSNINKRVMYI